MSRVERGEGRTSRQRNSTSEPWPAEATRRVRDLRGAITAEGGGGLVDTDVAPLLPDLLTRMEALGRPQPEVDLGAPDPPDAIEPPSAADELYVLRRAEEKLSRHIEQGVDDPAVHDMVRTLRHFRELREQVVIRSET